jgi:hypothetical protein
VRISELVSNRRKELEQSEAEWEELSAQLEESPEATV